MQNTLPIQPFAKPLAEASVCPPGSKSLTNRALVLAAMGRGRCVLEGMLFSRDTQLMLRALKTLGFEVSVDEANKTATVVGLGGDIPEASAELDVGNAGTVARFLTAFLCLKKGGTYQLDGDKAMRKRPMQGLFSALQAGGLATVTYKEKEGFFPATLQTKGVQALKHLQVDARQSSQLLSALLMLATAAPEPSIVNLEGGETVSKPFVGMTAQLVQQFGLASVKETGAGNYAITPTPSSQATLAQYCVEPDATAASYWIGLPIAVGGSIEVQLAQPSLQGDAQLANVLLAAGWPIELTEAGVRVVVQPGQKLPGVRANFNAISDTFLTLAALAPLMEGPTVLEGLEHTRLQETDRLSAMAAELMKLGQRVQEGTDYIEIEPAELIQGVTIDTYDDHRVAMSFALLGSHPLNGTDNLKPWLFIDNPMCCRKTYPNYFDVLESLRPA